MYKPKYITNLDQITEIPAGERKKLREVTEKFMFRTNEYYQKLINWDDPDDPIRRIVIPNQAELATWGRLDASDEEKYAVIPGLEHKYEFTVLLLVNDFCSAYCRFCFRKRIFMDVNDEVVRDATTGINYIREHPKVNNVLLTGGDPLIMSTDELENIIRPLREIEHVQIIRIGTKVPAYNPHRILNDPSLIDLFHKYSTDEKKIYIMAHFNHPRELTREAIEGMNRLRETGAVTVNQTPLIRGVNDNPNVLADLFNKLSYIGIPPYYLFICRPTLGNKTYAIPIEEAFEIFEQARMKCSGLAKRSRLVMSHSTGKIEIVGQTKNRVYFRYHRAANPQEKARFMIFKRNPNAYWYDDYDEIIHEYSIENPYRVSGPE
ncbi:MAG: KamA family radical SAM protein [Calditrichia bacterium]